MLIRTFLKAGEKVLTSEKTFSLYKIATTEFAGPAAYVETPMDENCASTWRPSPRRIDAANQDHLHHQSQQPDRDIRPGRRHSRTSSTASPTTSIIVLDNAYQEYRRRSRTITSPAWTKSGREKNVIVLRTFSKVYGLAGLRVGYAMANPEIIAILNRVKPPFNVTRIGQRAALASLDNDDYKNDRCA